MNGASEGTIFICKEEQTIYDARNKLFSNASNKLFSNARNKLHGDWVGKDSPRGLAETSGWWNLEEGLC